MRIKLVGSQTYVYKGYIFSTAEGMVKDVSDDVGQYLLLQKNEYSGDYYFIEISPEAEAARAAKAAEPTKGKRTVTVGKKAESSVDSGEVDTGIMKLEDSSGEPVGVKV
jgi:hypothetical protein